MYNENELPSSKRLEQSIVFLSKVEQLTQAHGKEWVENILSLGGLIPNAKDSQSFDATSIDSKHHSGSGVVFIDEVKALGIDIDKQIEQENISDLIKRSTYAQVETAIAIYKEKYLNKNKVYKAKAEKLFLTILSNEHDN
ncbi:MAG: hypothetical protein SWZ49_33625 [Cyanobacteriota bacterium]|nr:hypothetical protein [Cyanobacteriota bacterium]